MTLYITKNNQQLGPYTLAEAQQLVASGTLSVGEWAWYEGAADWMPLNQVPGFATGAGGGLPVPGSFPVAAVGAPRRPVLVWVICLFYFILIPFGLISVAATPYLISFSAGMQQGVSDSLQRQLDHTTDPAQKDRLLALQEKLRTNSRQMAALTHHGFLYYAIAIVSLAVNLTAAILLFMLRRFAFHAFVASFIFGLAGAAYNFTVGAFPHSGGTAQTVGFVIGIVVAIISWGIALAIIFYTWRLTQKGILR